MITVAVCVGDRMERGCCVLLDEQRCTKNRANCDYCVLSVEQICVKD
jgi:hypothetical protein